MTRRRGTSRRSHTRRARLEAARCCSPFGQTARRRASVVYSTPAIAHRHLLPSRGAHLHAHPTANLRTVAASTRTQRPKARATDVSNRDMWLRLRRQSPHARASQTAPTDQGDVFARVDLQTRQSSLPAAHRHRFTCHCSIRRTCHPVGSQASTIGSKKAGRPCPSLRRIESNLWSQ